MHNPINQINYFLKWGNYHNKILTKYLINGYQIVSDNIVIMKLVTLIQYKMETYSQNAIRVSTIILSRTMYGTPYYN